MSSTVVAPHAGAWIEIDTFVPEASKSSKSHLTQVRGLK